MIEAYAAATAADSVASASVSKEGKQHLVHIGCAVIVILAIVDCVLFYLYISAPPLPTNVRKAEKLRKNAGRDYDYSEKDPPLEDFPDPTGSNKGRQNSAGRFCSTSACAWLNSYLGEDVPDAEEPCDDFYAHVCTQRPHSVYADGLARLMVAVKDVLLDAEDAVAGGHHSRPFWREHAAVLQRCLDGGQSMLSAVDVASRCEDPLPQDCPPKMPEAPTIASNEFFRANPNATVDDFAEFIKRVVTQAVPRDGKDSVRDDVADRDAGSSPSPLPKKWVQWTCGWVSLAARCHLSVSTKRSMEKLLAYQRVWKAIYFAPFLGRQAEPLLGLVYRGPPAARLQACLSIMLDAFEDETLAAAVEVLAGAVDDLDSLLLKLGRDTRLVMRKFFRFTTAQADTDAEYLAFPRDVLSGVKDDTVTALLSPSDSAAVNTTIFSSQARVVYKGRQRRLLVAPGLLGLLVNVSSSMGAVLVPAIAAPILRAMLTDKWLEEAQTMSPDGLVSGVAQCLATRLNMSEAMSTATAAESVVLEPLMQLYRKRLADSEGTGTLLHSSYTNGQLFFVIWALGHCGEEGGSALVNSVARNSDRFSRAFQCTPDAAMFALERCPLNAAV
ncbi:uncharacterized protein LOC144103580 [Amblyomma americanum]